jgi:hypothetical protein
MNNPVTVAVVSIAREFWSFTQQFTDASLTREREFMAAGIRWIRVSSPQDVWGLHPDFVYVHGTALKWGETTRAFTHLKMEGVGLYPGFPGSALDVMRICILQGIMDYMVENLPPGKDLSSLAAINFYQVNLRLAEVG